MSGVEYSGLLNQVVNVASEVIAESQASKQAAAREIIVLNDVEDEARIMMQACKDPVAQRSLDREKLQAWCHDAGRVKSAISLSRVQREEGRQSLQTLVAISGVTATGSVVPFIAQASSSPDASGTRVLIMSQWLEPQQIEHIMEKVQCLLQRTGCDKPYDADHQSPDKHYANAWSHYRLATQDMKDPLAPFIAMRECIDGVLESLARRRRVRRPLSKAEGERVRELLLELRREDVPDDSVHRIADETKGIRGNLSGGKTLVHGRDFIGVTLRAASQWLESLLGCVDIAKLGP